MKNGKFCQKFEKWPNFESFWKIFYRVKWKMENSGKICWNLFKVENFGKKCQKWSIFLLKVWKIDKFRQIWKMFFPRIKWNIENFGKISWNLCKVEKFGKKCDKLQILLKVWKVAKFEEIFYRVKWKIENFRKISWNLWEVENFGKKCKKWSILLKVWKIDNFRQIWKNIFSTRKMKN